ncbi:hypothetical protein PVK06_041452 [Gossypium arboreum]|uniref:Disease resistance R13L4/SHOC-2-like LRR domain-containing protein n=1 Tax=Gossypium arboreum TaxID=29729 RepID=A0ABR0N8A1_GOSAR|nr:hypothetical protein PVK06_041452 [Gossypium arboreum]
MHDLMRDVCLSKAKQEKFLYIADQSNAYQLSTIGRAFRVFVHEFIPLQCIKSPCLRSLLFFDEFLPEENLEKVVPLTMASYFGNHDDEIHNPLVCFVALLICIVLTTELRGIWKYMFNNFNFLRVLDYESGGDAGWKLPNDIGKLIHLRFLRLRGLDFWSSKLPSSLSNLRIDPKHLAHLLLSCENISKLSIDLEIRRLPEYHYLSSNLAYIQLKRCKLEEDPMPTLEKLRYLKMLELHEEAFIGKEMFCSAQGFPKLEPLSLTDLNNLEEWKVGEGAMPSLQRLEIQSCMQLKKLPYGLRFIATLQEVKIG